MLKKSVAAILIVSAWLAVTCGNIFAAIPAVEREALIALYNSTDGPNWKDSTNWLGAPGTECNWYGVNCDITENYVTGLIVCCNKLTGSIPPELGNLSSLAELALHTNQLKGNIPSELGNLSNLTELVLYTNQLEGNIPAELGKLFNLKELILNNNYLTGSIPPELGNLSNLRELHLSQNHLTSIPAELGNLTNLEELDLLHSELTGTIPPELGNLKKLTKMDLTGNKLTGSIPSALGNLSNLTELYLHYNQLTGSIPQELGNLSNLGWLNLSYNQLTGSIPPELGNLKNLINCDLSYNQFIGSIPQELGNLSKLKWLTLSNNQLTGSIPPELGNLTNLKELDLCNNQLTGTIPSEVVNLNFPTLRYCFDNNQFSVNITSTEREALIALYNSTDGVNWKNNTNWLGEPGTECTWYGVICNYITLEGLSLSNNQLTGSIPPELNNLTYLSYGLMWEDKGLDLRRNSLYTLDADLRDSLNRKQIDGDWESYQLLNGGYKAASDLWIRAVIRTVEKGSVNAVWQKGGEGSTSGGDRVIWGYFYASPDDVAWGSVQNPDLFVKIWFDRSERVDVNFFHVSVPEIEVYSDYPYNGTPDEQGLATMSKRYIRHYYENGRSGVSEQYEDGLPASGYSPANLPSGVMTVNNLKFGSVINTVEKGGIEAVWQLGGQSETAGGHQVVWGYFYANPSDVTWGDKSNPDLFVKIWYDVSGRIDVNFFHVSVPDIEVYSDCPVNKVYDNRGTTILNDRYIRHEYYGMCSPDTDPANPPPSADFPRSQAPAWERICARSPGFGRLPSREAGEPPHMHQAKIILLIKLNCYHRHFLFHQTENFL